MSNKIIVLAEKWPVATNFVVRKRGARYWSVDRPLESQQDWDSLRWNLRVGRDVTLKHAYGRAPWNHGQKFSCATLSRQPSYE